MKQVLLFLGILLAFSGCKKAEKKVPLPIQVHEINIGFPIGKYASQDSFLNNKRSGLKIPYFWHLNLLNDSFHLKKEYYFTYKADSIYRRSGKYNLNNNPDIERFINLAKVTPNGQMFVSEDHIKHLKAFTGHIIHYRKGSENKIFFFDNQNTALRVLTDLTNTLDTLKLSQQITISIKSREDLMIEEANKINAFKNLYLAPPLIGAKIKFTPPIKIKN